MDITTFHCGEDIQWAKDFNRIVLISLNQNRAFILNDTEAILWEYLTLGYKYSELVTYLSSMLNISANQASATITQIIQVWEKEEIINRDKVT